jgi:hypothetical protein
LGASHCRVYGVYGVISIINGDYKATLVGGLNPSENISQLGIFFPMYGKNVPNHQPV